MAEETGDRAGARPLWWRIVNFPLIAMVIAVALYVGVMVLAGALAMRVLPKVPGLSREDLFFLIGAAALVALYKLVIRHLGYHHRDDLRLPGAAKELGTGLGAGFLVFSAAVAVAALLGVYRYLGEGDSSGLLAAIISPALFPAVSEEMLFRGILFRWLEEFGGSWVALVITSALFGAAHLMNPNATLIAAIGIAVEAGVMLGAAYMLTRSLWLAMGIHAAWNFAQGEVYDIPVSGTPVHGLLVAKLSGPPLLSGGGFGLEASVIAMVVATAFGLWLLWLAIKRGQLVQPMWVRRRREVVRVAA